MTTILIPILFLLLIISIVVAFADLMRKGHVRKRRIGSIICFIVLLGNSLYEAVFVYPLH
ncbi:hypothetical protein YK48G_12150 [Lentilactobacillus fungorum]|uniref:Uncharacterized protein n=1 Tax=Lentilactobacillus fungorum TaxID=2201250 RepID=A0ABQ3VY14_9LACO|nr:hypothetical protein YK48G_12150 [Lentilactobacillus fungorum]